MPERPRPDMDRTREALRRHDDHTGDEPPEDAPEDEPAGGEEDEEEEPGRAP